MLKFDARRTPLLLALLGIISPILQGCSNTQGPWAQYAKLARQSLINSFGGQSVGRDQAAAIPYASLGYRVNGSSQALLVLATNSNGSQIWTASSHVVLQTRDGRVTRSVGLPRDRAALTSQGTAALLSLSAALEAPYRSTRLIDLPDMGLFSVTLRCVTTARGRQLITILGAALSTTKVDETCQSSNPRWTFTDSYWIDSQNGFVWRSIQHLHPIRTTIEIEIFRPPE
jgi:hypothetical protein